MGLDHYLYSLIFLSTHYETPVHETRVHKTHVHETHVHIAHVKGSLAVSYCNG